ncbi:MAG TPA: secretin N-terminal domain-containing protein [Thermoanaerobaculia bacterium]|nr:secretin N-terminal domain-containing protein [Thermoanaerobaculia bacterium]
MKSAVALAIAVLLAAPGTYAQEKTPEHNTVREYRNRVFSIQHRDPRTIAAAVKLLGSGFQGSGLSVSDDLRTITVRDFPENIATIEEALKRLDRPVEQGPDIEMKIHVLIGSKSALPGSPLPDDLAPVVRQLQSTLSYAHYGLMTTAVHRTKPGAGIEGSGVADATLLGMTASQDRPVMLAYSMRNLTFGTSNERPTVEIGNVRFSMRVPLSLGGDSGVQYQDVGFETPVSLGAQEKVVIGTTSMRDKALIVVLMANIDR